MFEKARTTAQLETPERSRYSAVHASQSYPPHDRWDDWVEFDAKSWPKKVERRYSLVPTTCFNCEAACGLLAYVDQDTGEIQKLEGNPLHPGSRGRNCAKGPATINQIHDPERILFPLKRVGPRGEGQWERTTWDEVLDTFALKIRTALIENRRDEVVYHVGRPGHDGYIDRVLQAWGVDGHNSHTNICSSGARVGYALWQGADRPSPDYANAGFILLLSSHLETGHYFNPHAQRIIEGKMAGAKIAVIDPRLSNTASAANYWLSPWPGTEAALLLAMASVILREDTFDREFVRRWVNWEEFMREERPQLPCTFEAFIDAIKELYSEYTPEYAATECGVEAEKIVEVAREIARAGSRFSSHVWRSAASGNLGGWQVARALYFLNALTGSIGTEGGVSPNVWNKFVAAPFSKPAPQKVWNETLWPREYPLAHHEMSFLLPHLAQRRPRSSRRVLHSSLQPGVDEPRWNELGRSSQRRIDDRASRRAHSGVERDRVVRRLCVADGRSHGTARHHESGDSFRAVDLFPAARSASASRAQRRARRLHLRSEPGRGLGRRRVLDRAFVAHRSDGRAWGAASL